MSLNIEGINQLGYVVKNSSDTATKYQNLFGTDAAVIFEAEVTDVREGLDEKTVPPYKIRFVFITLGEL